MKSPFLFLTVLLIAASNCTIGQTIVNNEISLLYFLKVNNQNLDQTPYPYTSSNLSCVWYYSSEFDKNNYEKVKNDEFKRNAYYAQLRKNLKDKIDALSFKKEYCIFSQSEFGEYNFSDSSFPITRIFYDCQFLKDRTMLDHECMFTKVPITIGWIINSEFFNHSIKVSPVKAENLINTSKQLNGRVNRVLQTKIIFTFVNEPYFIQTRQIDGSIYNVLEKDGFIIYVKRIEFYSNGQLIASIKPNEDFEDPISGYKKINGEDSYHIIVKDYEKILQNYTIVVNRVNGNPSGPVKFYDVNGNLFKIVNCTSFFPNKITYSGDFVQFFEKDGKMYPSLIQQLKDNRSDGYYIRFDHDISRITLEYVSKKDETGAETVITSFMGPKDHTHLNVNQIPNDAQELIKKYDYNNYFQYSSRTSTTILNTNKQSNSNAETESYLNNKVSEQSDALNKILFSAYRGSSVKDYIAGSVKIRVEKKSDNILPTSTLFMFINKDDEIPYQNELIQHVSNWIKENIKLSTIDVNKINTDSLFKIELGFAERFTSSITGGETFWYADLKTSIIITKNGNQLKQDSFINSTPMFGGKKDKWIALEDAIVKCEKKLGKVLEDYIVSE